MSLNELTAQMIPAIEETLRQALERIEDVDGMRHMLAYHLGWEGPGAGPEARGKRIRPLLVLLAAAASGGDWRKALPGAASVELIHNFSLIHDDIEDNSPLRRGRQTVWKLWGIPQAINAGDAMFSLANLVILDLAEKTSPPQALLAARVLQETCLSLTGGQYLDIAFERELVIPLEAYWPMVGRKTAALLSAGLRIGAISAGASSAVCEAYGSFGRYLGLAFQVQDDLLGIWGDAQTTGKSAESDLVSGKKSLPVLFGLSQNGAFAARWAQGPIEAEEVPGIAELLRQEGAYDYALEKANSLTSQALQALDDARPQGEAGEALRSLALRLLNRKV